MQISMNVQLGEIHVSRTAITLSGITHAAAVQATPSAEMDIHVKVCYFGMPIIL
jgi:hypothetical protein